MTPLNMRDLSDSVRAERVNAIAAFGFTERQARFLVHVLVHAGVFLERQYCAFAGIAHGQKTHDFLAKLVGGRYATVITPGALHRGRLFHVQYKPLYEAIGEPDNRHRKPASLGRMVERLMLLDAVLADRNHTWLGTENDKLAYFILGLLQTRLRKNEYPNLTFGEGDNHTVRYFPDKLPIGVERNGGGRHVFLYLVTRDVPVDFRMFLQRHAELFRVVYEWTIRLLIPRRFRKAAALYRYAVRDELATPVHPSTVEELEWFFRERHGRSQRAPRHPDLDPNLDLATAAQKFHAARFRSLERMWLREGYRAVLAAQSPVLRDQLREGRGRIEFVELSHQYLQLTPLVGVA
jgi:hypothetical protein